MGEQESWAQPSGLLPNGLLPNAGPLIRVLDSERWLKAEERTAELIACIQPNQPSEERRNAVADYVQRLIVECFPCQVFTFGSVPLKTYLPDGDIDLTSFSNNQNMKDSWANQVRDMLEKEEKNENAEFRVKEVQYIQAEVKLIKCLVENIVVDISFNQLGGLCTLCFLEEVDHLIDQNHLFKRSIILIKAWCYYESRILGAHHGLISTYALETLVLYIFHVYNNTFTGPLEVLYRFLEFFSNFDWENFCVSLWGPVPISSLPDVTAEPPRKDSGELLLSKLFLDACSSVYAVFPVGQENQGQTFLSKHFNVIDPLRVNNNLGRSVSKGNFFRIRSAFAFGAKRLARLLDCPKEDLFYEVNQFFMNTWDRHGSGNRPDAPRVNVEYLRLTPLDNLNVSEKLKNSSCSEKMIESSSGCATVADANHPQRLPHQHDIFPLVSRSIHSQAPKGLVNSSSSVMTDNILRGTNSNKDINPDKGQRNVKSNHLPNDLNARYLFARTRSSPELTHTFTDSSSRNRRYETQTTSARHDVGRNNPSVMKHAPLNPSNDASFDSDNISNSSRHDFILGTMGEEYSSMSGMHAMHQEEQDLVNLMASSMLHGHNGQIHMPFSLASGHIPFPVPPSLLASMGQRNFGGMLPTNIPMIDPSFPNMQFPQGMMSQPLTHYFPGMALTANSEDAVEHVNENFSSVETDHGCWPEHDAGYNGGPESESVNLQSSVNPQPGSSNFVRSSWLSGTSNLVRGPQKLNKEGISMETQLDGFQLQDNRVNDHSDDRTTSSRFATAANSDSIRSRTSSESSWDGLSKVSKEKKGKKMVLTEPSTKHGALDEEDGRDLYHLTPAGNEANENGSGYLSLPNLRHHIVGHESQTTGSDKMVPMTPVILGPGSRQRGIDNSSELPFAFYATGPPVPFLTMLPFSCISSETTSNVSTSHFGGEDNSVDASDSGQNLDSHEGPNHAEELNSSSSRKALPASAITRSVEHNPDILNSDFESHWQNLQFGRVCQNPHYGPGVFPHSTVVPPMYMQGHSPWDGPGRPVSSNMNLITQLMRGYGPHYLPMAPLQSMPNRPPNVYQRYFEDMPRYRTGTGTYLPNPKNSPRDRQSFGNNRRGNYSHDRSDNGDYREGHWQGNSKSRGAGRNQQNRNQSEKLSSRGDRIGGGDSSRGDRPWNNSYRNDPSQNGPQFSSSNQSGPSDVGGYNMYTLPAMNQNGVVTSNSTGQYMVYPYDPNSSTYSVPPEHLEFGSLGPMGVSNLNDQNEGNHRATRGQLDGQRFHGGSEQRSSLDQQPSSPHHNQRKS
ncbi:uncharacterized protein LOC124923858 [Impatiens glandulifera]|uniref:uncharacterized protein LOC124923858 n=1 Tax=Impatiens glandulifera TaxID=253017 RepID=UPI001FB0C129|nr:uncharacterized protein LOC124923858 [Impatiens glandulifera]